MKLILIAPSGGGKGSIAELLIRDFKIPHVSTGQIFRDQMAAKTPIGLEIAERINKGIFISDELTMKMLLERLKEPDCKNGFILDGVPRTLNQAQILAKHVDIDAAVGLDVSDEIVMKRLLGRWMCKKCNTIHNSSREDVSKCKNCGHNLYQRDDDKEEGIRMRLKQYREQSDAILDFYRKSNKLFTIHVKGNQTPAEEYALIMEYLAKTKKKTAK